MNKQDIGERLKEARERLKLTQGKVCDELGIPNVQTLSAYERGTTAPPVEALIKLSKLYKVSTDWLLFGEEYSTREGKSPKEYLLQLVEAADFFKMGFNSYEDCFQHVHVQIDLCTAPYCGIEQFSEKWMKIRNLFDTDTIDRGDYNVLIEKTISNLELTLTQNQYKTQECGGSEIPPF